MPAQLVLSSPWTDLALDNPDLVDQNSKDPWLNLEGLKEASAMWAGPAGEAAFADPLVSPIWASLARGLPKISMSIGTRELLYPDQLLFWNKLERESEGRSTGTLTVGGGMVHVYAILGDMPETEEPWRVIAAVIEDTRGQSTID